MTKTRQLARAALLAFITFGVASVAGAAGFNQFVVFGDSTLDSGYFALNTSGDISFDQKMHNAILAGNTGGWAGNGVMNTVMLADRFGLSLAPYDLATGTGTNFANGGATTVVNHDSMVPDNVCTLSQIEIYLASVNGVANPNALYLIKTGDNDVTFVQYSRDAAWRAAHPTYLSDGAENLAVQVARLQAAGARTIVVRNSYDSALFAGPGGDIPALNAEVYHRSHTLGTEEWQYLTAHGVHFIPADNDSLFRFIAHNPTLFGFTEHSVRSYNAKYFFPHVPAAFDTPDAEYQQSYLFIDGVHLTTAGQTIEADYTYSLLAAPSQMSLLAESVIQNGWAHAATIQGQIDPHGQKRGPRGVNAWTSAGVYNLQVRNTPGMPSDLGTPFGGSVGVDYQTPSGLVVGAAFSAGNQSPAFSTSGHFDQVEEAPSLYAAYQAGPAWGSAIMTYQLLQDDISRDVPLGIFTDRNRANTTGQSLGLALRGGVDLTQGPILTGPVAGMVMQQAFVNGFTETSDTGITALSFGNQTRNSLVSQFGWRALAEMGDLQPFTEMNWNHEWASTNRMVTATLTSVSAPSYSMDAVPAVSDWATLSLGAYYRLNPRVVLRGAASSMFINPQMVTCGGELGMNVSF